VLEIALEAVPQPLPEDDPAKPVEAVAPAAPASGPDLLTH
jgi:hypothetical protein